jgi:hypothetical protein
MDTVPSVVNSMHHNPAWLVEGTTRSLTTATSSNLGVQMMPNSLSHCIVIYLSICLSARLIAG